MPVDDPAVDARWDRAARHETETERLDRNWSSLLQELRVVQTGVQLLTGLLLTLPFQPRFDVLDDGMRVVYLITVGCSVASTVLLVAPVGMHRLLFRRHRLDTLVSAAHRCAYAGLLLLGPALAGVSTIVFYAVTGRAARCSGLRCQCSCAGTDRGLRSHRTIFGLRTCSVRRTSNLRPPTVKQTRLAANVTTATATVAAARPLVPVLRPASPRANAGTAATLRRRPTVLSASTRGSWGRSIMPGSYPCVGRHKRERGRPRVDRVQLRNGHGAPFHGSGTAGLAGSGGHTRPHCVPPKPSTFTVAQWS